MRGCGGPISYLPPQRLNLVTKLLRLVPGPHGLGICHSDTLFLRGNLAAQKVDPRA